MSAHLLVMKLAGFVAGQMENMRWAALGKNELGSTHHPQDQPPEDVFALAGGVKVSAEQSLVKFPGSRTHGKGQRPGGLIETLGSLGYELVVIGG